MAFASRQHLRDRLAPRLRAQMQLGREPALAAPERLAYPLNRPVIPDGAGWHPEAAPASRDAGRTWAPLYLRGLLGPRYRKTLQPMAARLGLPGHEQLQHFIASRACDESPLWAELARTTDRLVGGSDDCPVIDDTALPKKGIRSVGVARQYCGALGKKASPQSLAHPP